MSVAGNTHIIPSGDEPSTQSSLIIRTTRTVALHQDYGPGTFVDKLYKGLGKKIGKGFDQLAQNFNIGPKPVAQNIQNAFGVQEQRLSKLKELHGSDEAARKNLPIAAYCSTLLGYTLHTEAPETRLQAFNCFILVVSLYPGLRQLFLMDKIVKRVKESSDGISTLWEVDGLYSAHWKYKRDLAAAFLSDNMMGNLVEIPQPEHLGYVDSNKSHSVIESLVVIIDCDDGMGHSRAIAIRYLGGILQLPTFWLRNHYRHHSSVMLKLLRGLANVVKDLDPDTFPSGDIQPSVPDSVLDLDGVDLLVEAVFTGILEWSKQDVLTELPSWWDHLIVVVQLLYSAKVQGILPQAWCQLSTSQFQTWFPTTTTMVISEEYQNSAPTSDQMADKSQSKRSSTSSTSSIITSASTVNERLPSTMAPSSTRQEEINDDEVVIIVVGHGGSGKSTLINHLTGSDLSVFHNLKNVPHAVQRGSKLEWGNRIVTLIDTPGVDASPWYGIVQEVYSFLNKPLNKKLNGVIYLQPIYPGKPTTVPKPIQQIVKEVCQTANLERLVIVRTWDFNFPYDDGDFGEATIVDYPGPEVSNIRTFLSIILSPLLGMWKP